RDALDRGKIAVAAPPTGVTSTLGHSAIQVDVDESPKGRDVPVLLATTFHPNWSRADGAPIYAATPFYMLTFADRQFRLDYGRRGYERAALYLSAGALVFTCLLFGWRIMRVFRMRRVNTD